MAMEAAGFARKTVRLASGEVTYHVGGAGRPILYLHSAGGIRISPALQDLAKRFRIYLPVAPGFDGTEGLADVATVPDLAKLAAEFADSVIGESCDVIGHSFGGYVAAWFAVLNPTRLGQLVLECAAGFRLPDAPPLPSDPALLQGCFFAHPERIPAGDSDPARAAANRVAADSYMGGTRMDAALLGRLGEIGCLTLILQGTKDGVIGAASARLIKARIPRSHLIYVYDAAHVIEIDQPTRFATLVGDFLERAEGFLVNWTGQVAGVARPA